MKIAVASQGDRIFQHFGQCRNFSVFTVEDGKVKNVSMLDASQNGHAALSGFLKDEGINVVICGGIGEGARQMLSDSGIQLFSGLEGGINDAVISFLLGELTDQGGSCSHLEHGEDHVCSCKDHCKQP